MDVDRGSEHPPDINFIIPTSINDFHEFNDDLFISYCKDKFGWEDLSKDVIMDVGCGKNGYCGQAILDKFPNVGTIIGIDEDFHEVKNFKLESSTTNIECVEADIEKRRTLVNYEGKMTKVVSTYLFQTLKKKEKAFRNVYRLLKPGGEAAFLIPQESLLYEMFTEFLKLRIWQNWFMKDYIEETYRDNFGEEWYTKLVQEMGFQVIHSEVTKKAFSYPSDSDCKRTLVRYFNTPFLIPCGQREFYGEEAFKVLLQLSPRDSEGNPCYTFSELYLLLRKPIDDSETDDASETK